MIDAEHLNIVIVGHVDHGKSTIIGRLLADTHSLPEGKLEQIREKCRRSSKPFEYAFLLDALKDEQEQGITIDSARCFFKTQRRKYIIIDAPGHVEFIKNMVTGAARADAALLVIDAEEGIRENSKRHGYLLSILGIRSIGVLINKMDRVDYREDVYSTLVSEYTTFMQGIGLTSSFFIPVSGREGENIAHPSESMPWYQGPTVLQALDELPPAGHLLDLPLRMPVQGVYKFTKNEDNRRIVVGTIETGQIHVGDEVVFYPSGKRSQVKTIEAFNGPLSSGARAGQATGFTLTEEIYVKRGEMAARASEVKPWVQSRIKVFLFWLGKEPLGRGRRYLLKLGTAKVGMHLDEVVRVFDPAELKNVEKTEIGRHEVGECILQLEKPVAFDLAAEISPTGRFVIIDGYEISGGGIIEQGLERNLVWHEGKVSHAERYRNLGQKGLIVWFTGLSGSGKSTIAVELEKELVRRGRACYRLDGDNIRQGLNSDLGFSPEERRENIRRVAEVAALFQDAGLLVLVAFISPYRTMREMAREKAGQGHFLEVYVKADLETCARRDPKGLYKKAEQGQIKNFTGVSDVYEEPDNADLTLDTTTLSIEQSVQCVLDKILALA